MFLTCPDPDQGLYQQDSNMWPCPPTHTHHAVPVEYLHTLLPTDTHTHTRVKGEYFEILIQPINYKHLDRSEETGRNQ